MQQIAAPRRDPAPSRMAYRIQRLWLTPLFRVLLRVGLPVLVVVLGLALFFGNEKNREELVLKYTEMRSAIEERPEFIVKLMAVDGGSGEVADDIREIVPIDFPVSSFDLDLENIRATIDGLDAVEKVDVRIRTGGILQVTIQERIPAVVWRGRTDIELLDAKGHRVSGLSDRNARADLPLIAGEGAETSVPEALEILAAASPIASRVRGLVRMGERRWDLVLDRDQRILLPENNPVAALDRVIVLNQAQDLLARDLVAIDMRYINRPTIRLAEPAVEELRRIKGLELGATR